MATPLDRALTATDAIEASLDERIAEVYSAALKKAVRNNRLFLTNVKELDARAEKLKESGWSAEKLEKWRKEEVLRLLRQQRVVEAIAKEMDKAGIEIAPEIKGKMVEVYKVNSDATFQQIGDVADVNFAMLPKEQIRIILDDTEPVFSKIAYNHIGENKKIRSMLQSEFAQGALLRESQDKLVKRIMKVTGQLEYQARRVAQTERTRVQSQARYEAGQEAQSLGVRVANQWSTKMHNSRETHIKRDGLWAMQGEVFPGSDMRYPGDPAGGAAEVINCHCVLVPDVLWDDEIITADGRRVKGNRAEKGLRTRGDSSTIDLQLFAEKDLKNQKVSSIKKGIASFREQIEAHRLKIENPNQYDTGWDSKSGKERRGLLKHWEKEISNFEKSVQARVDELARRGEKDDGI